MTINTIDGLLSSFLDNPDATPEITNEEITFIAEHLRNPLALLSSEDEKLDAFATAALSGRVNVLEAMINRIMSLNTEETLAGSLALKGRLEKYDNNGYNLAHLAAKTRGPRTLSLLLDTAIKVDLPAYATSLTQETEYENEQAVIKTRTLLRVATLASNTRVMMLLINNYKVQFELSSIKAVLYHVRKNLENADPFAKAKTLQKIIKAAQSEDAEPSQKAAAEKATNEAKEAFDSIRKPLEFYLDTIFNQGPVLGFTPEEKLTLGKETKNVVQSLLNAYYAKFLALYPTPPSAQENADEYIAAREYCVELTNTLLPVLKKHRQKRGMGETTSSKKATLALDKFLEKTAITVSENVDESIKETLSDSSDEATKNQLPWWKRLLAIGKTPSTATIANKVEEEEEPDEDSEEDNSNAATAESQQKASETKATPPVEATLSAEDQIVRSPVLTLRSAQQIEADTMDNQPPIGEEAKADNSLGNQSSNDENPEVKSPHTPRRKFS